MLWKPCKVAGAHLWGQHATHSRFGVEQHPKEVLDINSPGVKGHLSMLCRWPAKQARKPSLVVGGVSKFYVRYGTINGSELLGWTLLRIQNGSTQLHSPLCPGTRGRRMLAADHLIRTPAPTSGICPARPSMANKTNLGQRFLGT